MLKLCLIFLCWKLIKRNLILKGVLNMKKNSKKSITKEQIMKVAEILELGDVKFSMNKALMKCPFHCKGNHNLVINMNTYRLECIVAKLYIIFV